MADLQTQALDQLAHQYAESPNLQAVVSLLVGECEVARDAMDTLSELRTLESAEGDGLDGAGQILGQPREIAGIIDLEFFEYHDGLGGDAQEGFGDDGDASAGSRYRSIFESPTANALLGDAEYRQMLEAKILRNRTAATINDVIASIYAVLGEPTNADGGPIVSYSTVGQLANFTVFRVLSAEELALLNASTGIRGEIPVVPRPIGVGLTIIGQ